jgi:hypothetical protein
MTPMTTLSTARGDALRRTGSRKRADRKLWRRDADGTAATGAPGDRTGWRDDAPAAWPTGSEDHPRDFRTFEIKYAVFSNLRVDTVGRNDLGDFYDA